MTSANNQHIDAVLAHVDRSLDDSLARLFELIRIPSVSTDPAYRDHCRTAAEWLSRDLAAIGFEASVRKTTGHPMTVITGAEIPCFAAASLKVERVATTVFCRDTVPH